jgi:hypothetical protein
MPAGEHDYDGVPYADLVFEDIDWSEIETEWATEACQDERRWVRSAGSASGLTVKVTGYSAMAGFVVTVIVAPKDHPPQTRWWDATAWAAKPSEVKMYEEGQ